MKSQKSRGPAGLVALLLLITAAARTQEKASSDKELNLRAYTELLRADVKVKRVAIITEIMQFDDTEAASFWPIFRAYDLELSKIGDGRISQIENQIQHIIDLQISASLPTMQQASK